jgi:hypothetical protein
MARRNVLFVQLQSHRYLIDTTFDFTFKDQSDEKFFDLIFLDVQLLGYGW